jgi:hypothetical protein
MESPRLVDELLILTINPHGRISAPTGLDYALAGGVLLELALAEQIDVVDGRPTVIDPRHRGDAVLDEALDAIAAHRRRTKRWVTRLYRGLRKRVLAHLSAAGMVHVETGRILGIFPTVRYPVQDIGFVEAVRQRVGAAVDGGGPVDPRTAALCSLIVSIGLERRLFPDRARAARRRLTEIAKGNWAGEAVRAAVLEVQAAMIAVTVAGVAAAGSG